MGAVSEPKTSSSRGLSGSILSRLSAAVAADADHAARAGEAEMVVYQSDSYRYFHPRKFGGIPIGIPLYGGYAARIFSVS